MFVLVMILVLLFVVGPPGFPSSLVLCSWAWGLGLLGAPRLSCLACFGVATAYPASFRGRVCVCVCKLLETRRFDTIAF